MRGKQSTRTLCWEKTLLPYKKRHHPITTRFHAKSLLCFSVTVTPTFHWKKLDNNIQTDILYLDFAKTFDSVDHAILLERLKRYGVAEHLHDWFKNYPQDRQ